MSATIPAVYVQTYETNVRHLAQQGITRLRPWVDERSVQSEGHNWERMAATIAQQKTTRAQPTPDNETAWSRRKSIPVTYDTGDVTEVEDIVQMIVDPNSNYARAQAMAMKRAYDDEIISAAVGDSRDGDGNAIVFDDTNQEVGTGLTAITYDLVTQTSEIFMNNDIDPDEGKVFVISPAQARKLLQLTEATSGDYNAMRPLTSQGYIESWMGYTWIVSTRLQDPAINAAGESYCFAMTKKALGLQVNKDIWVEIAQDPSISFAWRIYCASTYGAIRVEDEQLVRLDLTETI
jgi:hypothetical protein